MSTPQYYVANLDSTKEQASVSFYSERSLHGSYTRRGTIGLYDLIDITVPESGYYTIKAQQGWTSNVSMSYVPSLSDVDTRLNGGVTEYNLKLDDNNAWSHGWYGSINYWSPERKHMLPAIALYTNVDHLTGWFFSTQRSLSFRYSTNRYSTYQAGDNKCIGQGIPLMDEDTGRKPAVVNYYNYYDYQTLSSTEVKVCDYGNGEGRDFVYLSAGHTYTLLATQVPSNGPLERKSAYSSFYSTSGSIQSLTAHGQYGITVEKISHVTYPGLSSSEGGLYIGNPVDRTGSAYNTATVNNLRQFTEEFNGETFVVTVLRQPTFLGSFQEANYDLAPGEYWSGDELFEIYYNKWSVGYDLDESSQGTRPVEFNLLAGDLNFGKWIAYVSNGDPATTECDFIITRKADRRAIRVQGELSYANYKSLSCTDVTGMVNTPSLQRLRNLGYV